MGEQRVVDRLRRAVQFRAAAIMAIVAVNLALHAHPASAAWTAPVDLSAGGQSADGEQVAVDPHGNALVVWRRSDGTNDRIEARTRSAAGVLGAVRLLSRAGSDAAQPQVAMDGHGNALVAWTRVDGAGSRIEARLRKASGELGPILTVAGSGSAVGALVVAMSPNGRTLVAWSRLVGSVQRVQVRWRSATGTLSATQTVSPPGQSADSPQAAIAPNGNAIVVWRLFSGSNYQVQLRPRTAGGALGAVKTLSPSDRNADSPHVAVDPDGDAVVVWRILNGAVFRIQAAARSAAGALGAARMVSPPSVNSGAFPRVGMDADGDAVVAWYANNGDDVRVYARTRRAGGVFSAVAALSPAGLDAGPPQLAVDADGNSVVGWLVASGGIFRAQARTRPAAGPPTPVVFLSASGVNASAPDIAGNASGITLAAWVRSGSPFTRVQASAGP